MKNVKVFTSQTWPHCPAVKNYLTEKNVPFEEKDINADMEARKELIQRRIMSVPTIIIDDTEVIVGFDKEKIDSILGR